MNKVETIVNQLCEFIAYVDSFYNEKNGIYPIKDMTDKMVINAVQKYIATNAESFCGDSVDREKVRDIILNDNGLTFCF